MLQSSGPSLPEPAMRVRVLFVLLLASLLGGCGYNQIQQSDEATKAAWSEVVNQYQRRADLIPNLVATVKGYAAQEERVLREVTEARARAGSIQVTPELASDPAALARFQAAQGELSGALSRLLVVTENYPNLKSDQGFRDLQAQLEGTENRITVARNRYIQAIESYNTLIRRFPVNMTAGMFGYDEKPQFTVENERAISTAPTVDFTLPPAGSTMPAATPVPAPVPLPTPAAADPQPDPESGG
jgi:LemA protein